MIDAEPRTRGAVLLYDGTCGFCAGSVQFVLQHERPQGTLKFASLQGEVGTDVQRRHPELGAVDSVIWYAPASAGRPETLCVKSDAILEVGRYLGGLWSGLATLARIVPRRLRDATYDLIARHRYQIAASACLLPSPEQRSRFLDVGGPSANTPSTRA